MKNGESGLLHASTGSGKTYAVWFAALNRFAKANTLTADNKPRKRKTACRTAECPVDHDHS
ncbi:helicase, partial [Pseudomonas syringae pv. japonica str. M301072]